MRICELARVWGVSPSYVARLAKKGMPLSSVAEADAWRVENLQKPPRSQSGAAAVKVAVGEAIPEIKSGDEDSTLARLKRARKAERMAFALLEQLAVGGNSVALRAGVHAFGEAARRANEAELAYTQHQQLSRQLISRSEVEEKYTKYLGGIRQLMDAMPGSLCARANPSDPECAKQAIEEGVNQIYLSIQRAEGAFN